MARRKRTLPENTADDLDAAARPAEGKCRPGSIEQQLDMCESGPLRGDEVLHNHGRFERNPDQEEGMRPMDPEMMEHNFHFDMSEGGREGDEESGDEHSSGLQGEEQQEQQYDTEFGDSDSGAPGEMTEKNAHHDPSLRGYRKRAA
jgi:hypothetical protein